MNLLRTHTEAWLITITTGATSWRFCTADTDIAVPDYSGWPTVTYETWPALPLLVSDIERSGVGSASLTLTAPRDFAPALAWLASPPVEPMTVTVLPYPTGSRFPVFAGVVRGVEWQGSQAVLSCGAKEEAAMERNLCTRNFGSTCQHALYGAACGVAKEEHTETTTAGTVTGGAVEVALALDPDTLKGGLVKARGHTRTIRSATTSLGGVLIQFSHPIPGFIAGDEVEVSQGCDRLLPTCKARFDNVPNFGGFPLTTRIDPFQKIWSI